MAETRIIPSEEFRRQAKRLSKKYKSLADDLADFQRLLLKNPFIGTDLGGGKRKIRLKVASKGKGKRGGVHVITYNIEKTEEALMVYLITLYDKSEFENVSDKYVDQIIKGLE